MKTSSILKVAVLAIPLFLGSCASKKKAVVQNTQTLTAEQRAGMGFIDRVKDNAISKKFITSKVKFSVEVGAQKLTLTGNLKMKRDDVIRLQLMAFGFVEAGRIELTKDYVLIMDRINKQYLKAPYMQVPRKAIRMWLRLRRTPSARPSRRAITWSSSIQPVVWRSMRR